jgi:hypothetical protein
MHDKRVCNGAVKFYHDMHSWVHVGRCLTVEGNGGLKCAKNVFVLCTENYSRAPFSPPIPLHFQGSRQAAFFNYIGICRCCAIAWGNA